MSSIHDLPLERDRVLHIPRASTSVQLFDFDGVELRTAQLDGEPAFVLADIARLLGYRNASDAGRLLRDHHKGYADVRTPGGVQQMIVVNERGFNRLVMRSSAPNAEQVQDWISDEVLPSITHTGSYSTQPALTEDEIVRQALMITTRKVEALEAKVEADAPAVEYVERHVAPEDDTVTFRVAAQHLGVTESELRQALVDAHRIYRASVERRWSATEGRVVTVYEWRAYAEWAPFFCLRAQHNAPRLHNGQVRQTLYIRAYALPKIARWIGAEVAA